MTKRGKKLTIIGLEDSTAKLDVVVFSEVYEALQTDVQTGQMIVVEGEIATDDYSGGVKMTANQLYTIEEARTRFAKCLQLSMTAADGDRLPALQSILKANQGGCVVQIRYSNTNANATLTMGTKWCVKPSDELVLLLADLLGPDKVQVTY